MELKHWTLIHKCGKVMYVYVYFAVSSINYVSFFFCILPQQTLCSPLQWVRKQQHPAHSCSLEHFSARYKLRWPMGSLVWTVRHTWKEHLWVLDFGPCVIYKYTNQILIRCENKGHIIRPFAIPLQPRGCFHSLWVSRSCPKKLLWGRRLWRCGKWFRPKQK